VSESDGQTSQANLINSKLVDQAVSSKIEQLKKQCEQEEKAIKQVYTELDLPGLWAKFEEESHQKIIDVLGAHKQLPKSIFETVLKMIYKRKK